LPLSQ